jgi:hypothetical protein
MAPVAASGPLLLASPNLDGTAVSWMEANWMFIGLAGGLFGLGVLVGRARQRDQHWYGWLALVMYFWHQVEEHAYDFRGWRYAFVPYMNEGLGKVLFHGACDPGHSSSCPIDPKMTLYINTTMIWVGFGACNLAGHLYPERCILAGSLCWGTATVNGLGGHIIPALATMSYNPGVVQSMVMVPLGIFVIRACGRPGLCIASGVAAHIIAFGMGLNLVLRAHMPEVATTIVFNLLAGLVLPLGLAWPVQHLPNADKDEIEIGERQSQSLVRDSESE